MLHIFHHIGVIIETYRVYLSVSPDLIPAGSFQFNFIQSVLLSYCRMLQYCPNANSIPCPAVRLELDLIKNSFSPLSQPFWGAQLMCERYKKWCARRNSLHSHNYVIHKCRALFESNCEWKYNINIPNPFLWDKLKLQAALSHRERIRHKTERHRPRSASY
jgi:hypothetical protein